MATKKTAKKKIASKMLPENWRDNGLRFNLEGTLTYSNQTYNVSSRRMARRLNYGRYKC